MDDRFNTIAGWTLFAGIIALGSSIIAGEHFASERPEKMGYPIEGVAVEGDGAAAAELPVEAVMHQKSTLGARAPVSVESCAVAKANASDLAVAVLPGRA